MALTKTQKRIYDDLINGDGILKYDDWRGVPCYTYEALTGRSPSTFDSARIKVSMKTADAMFAKGYLKRHGARNLQVHNPLWDAPTATCAVTTLATKSTTKRKKREPK